MFKTLKWGYKAEKREGYLGSERIEWSGRLAKLAEQSAFLFLF